MGWGCIGCTLHSQGSRHKCHRSVIVLNYELNHILNNGYNFGINVTLCISRYVCPKPEKLDYEWSLYTHLMDRLCLCWFESFTLMQVLIKILLSCFLCLLLL